MPASNCKFDFDYKIHGGNWKCNCNEGLQQSPVNLSQPEGIEDVDQNMLYEYKWVEPQDMRVSFDRGAIRIKAINKASFGFMRAPQPSNLLFEVDEIIFRTPGEHKIRN